jgi:hypothetical protein
MPRPTVKIIRGDLSEIHYVATRDVIEYVGDSDSDADLRACGFAIVSR